MTTPVAYALATAALILIAWCTVFPRHGRYVFVALSLASMAHWAVEVSA